MIWYYQLWQSRLGHLLLRSSTCFPTPSQMLFSKSKKFRYACVWNSNYCSIAQRSTWIWSVQDLEFTQHWISRSFIFVTSSSLYLMYIEDTLLGIDSTISLCQLLLFDKSPFFGKSTIVLFPEYSGNMLLYILCVRSLMNFSSSSSIYSFISPTPVAFLLF